jgi:DUF971 family protein
MPIPVDPRKKPLNIKIHVSTGAGVDITWADNHTSHYDFAYLRDECPCATCNEKREQERQNDQQHPGRKSTPISSPVLPMYKPKIRAQSATQVGNYAVQINFNDGHNTGIFSHEHLRTICPCSECAATFRNLAK